MSKIDIRLRRQQFTQGRIQRHKNYGSVLEKHRSNHRRRVRGIVILAFILILIIVVIFSYFSQSNAESFDKQLHKTEILSNGPNTSDL